jgi:CBS domain-containing protein
MKTANDMLGEKGSDLVCVPEGSFVLDALKQMNARKVGAILVTRDGKPVGIWTERDLMRNILDAAFDPKTTRIEDVMTKDLIFCFTHRYRIQPHGQVSRASGASSARSKRMARPLA